MKKAKKAKAKMSKAKMMKGNTDNGGGQGQISNPIQLLTNYTPKSETSVVDQSTTTYKIGSSGIISRDSGLVFQTATPIKPAFAIILTTMLYAPKGDRTPIRVSDEIPPLPDGTPGRTRNYTELFDLRFGNGFRVASFILNNISPIGSPIEVTVTHPLVQRRVVTAEMYVNFAQGNPLDRLTTAVARSRNNGSVAVESTNPTVQASELIYGVIGIGGKVEQFLPPLGYIALTSVDTNIDEFDCHLKTFYKLTSSKETSSLSATVAGTSFFWGGAITSLKSLILE